MDSGYAIKLGAFVPFVDIKGGAAFGDDSESGGTSIWSGSGGCFGFDLGSYIDIGKWLVFGIRYQYTGVTIDFDGYTGNTVGLSSFFVSAGIRFLIAVYYKERRDWPIWSAL